MPKESAISIPSLTHPTLQPPGPSRGSYCAYCVCVYCVCIVCVRIEHIVYKMLRRPPKNHLASGFQGSCFLHLIWLHVSHQKQYFHPFNISISFCSQCRCFFNHHVVLFLSPGPLTGYMGGGQRRCPL